MDFEGDSILKMAEMMSAVTKINELRFAVNACGDAIIKSAGGRKTAVLAAIRPFMDERRRLDIDVIVKMTELCELLGQLRGEHNG